MNDFLEFGSAGGDDGCSGTICSGVGIRFIACGGDDGGGGSVETTISEAGDDMVVEQRCALEDLHLQSLLCKALSQFNNFLLRSECSRIHQAWKRQAINKIKPIIIMNFIRCIIRIDQTLTAEQLITPHI